MCVKNIKHLNKKSDSQNVNSFHRATLQSKFYPKRTATILALELSNTNKKDILESKVLNWTSLWSILVRFPDPLGKWVGRTNPLRAGNFTSEASSTENVD